MASKSLPSRKRPRRKSDERQLRRCIFERMVSEEAGGAAGYGPDLVANMECVYQWILGQRTRPYVVVDNKKLSA